MNVRDEDYETIKEQLGEDLAHASFNFWMDTTLDKYVDEDNKWILLLAYQRGYAKAVEDNAIPEFDEYDEAEVYSK